MNGLKLLLAGLIGWGLVSCQQPSKTADSTSSTTAQEDALKADPPSADDIEKGSARDTLITPSGRSDRAKFPIREGQHQISLQWISWDDLGEADVEYIGENRYRIKGEQRHPKNGDYLRLEGTLEPVSETELMFEGKVEHQVSHLNQGRPCIKTGKQIFKATQNRKYWRMQDMTNCEGGMVTDYVDIYF